jgi:hypothetical protein
MRTPPPTSGAMLDNTLKSGMRATGVSVWPPSHAMYAAQCGLSTGNLHQEQSFPMNISERCEAASQVGRSAGRRVARRGGSAGHHPVGL